MQNARGSADQTPQGESRHQLLRVDLTDAAATEAAVRQADPDLVLHLAAESHVNGTFHLLQAVRGHWEALPAERQQRFRLHHISTELGWQPHHNFEQRLTATVDWYLANLDWCQTVCPRTGYQGERIGSAAI
jgi:dTDP-D-glucose 4,6-dehydratase